MWPHSAAYSRDGRSVYGRTRSRSSSLSGGCHEEEPKQKSHIKQHGLFLSVSKDLMA